MLQTMRARAHIYPEKPRKPEELVCIFCGAPKTWKSAFLVADEDLKGRLFVMAVVRVCPPCRSKHTIQELYEKLTEGALRNVQEVINRERKVEADGR